MRLQQELQQAVVELLDRGDLPAGVEHRLPDAVQRALHGLVLQPLDAELSRLVPAGGEGRIVLAKLIEGGALERGPGGGAGDRGGLAQMGEEGLQAGRRHGGAAAAARL